VKVALALLCDEGIQDAVNRLAFDCHFQYGVALDIRKIPPHVSLKQPFEIGETIEELDTALSHLERVAATIESSVIRLGECAIWPGVLHFPVIDSHWLRAAHELLNSSLHWAPHSGRADFDGPDYRFHLSVLSDMTAVAKIELCLELAQSIQLEPFTPRKGAVIAYHQRSSGSEWDYVHIKTVRLGSKAS
jgi:2'-5' RNA ligase